VNTGEMPEGGGWWVLGFAVLVYVIIMLAARG
jgi:hypothetical protein